MWNDPERAQQLGQERARLEAVVEVINELEGGIAESGELLQMVEEEQDNSMLDEVRQLGPSQWLLPHKPIIFLKSLGYYL